MPESQIRLIDSKSGHTFPAAPKQTVLLSSADAGWHGIAVELHRIPPRELPEHYVQGHRLIVHVGKPTRYEWKDGDRWRQDFLKPGDFCLQTHGEINRPRWRETFEFLAISLEPGFVSTAFHDSIPSASIQFQAQRCKHDPIIAHFAKRLHAEIKVGSYQGTLYGESMAMAFALALFFPPRFVVFCRH